MYQLLQSTKHGKMLWKNLIQVDNWFISKHQFLDKEPELQYKYDIHSLIVLGS